MIDHLGLSVTDFDKAKAFYTAALAPLDYVAIMEFGVAVGFGADGHPDFWIHQGEKVAPHLHIAFRAATRAHVDAFYEAAIAAGGVDNGAPGPRPNYHPNYYAAFVLDADGHNIEAVCHTPK